PRLGDVNPEQDPWRSELAQDQIEVFDLTDLRRPGDNAHSRAFSDVTSVVDMIKQRLSDGQEMTDAKSISPISSIGMD
ncbi:MAG: alpha/beta hydrolase, partial [Candidatus Acidiferrum sp.]